MLYPVLRDMNNWLDNDFDDMLNTSWMPRMNVTAPAINVKENDKAYEVELAAPGTTKDDFKVNVLRQKLITVCFISPFLARPRLRKRQRRLKSLNRLRPLLSGTGTALRVSPFFHFNSAVHVDT